MSPMDAVAVVVLSWNRRTDTLACIASLERATYPSLSVVCVDNASSDGSADAVAASFPDVHVLRLDENLGFAGGMNAGIQAALAAGADHVLVLNNDMLVEPEFAEPLVSALDPSVGAVCAQILFADPPDRVWYAGARYRPRRGYQGRHVRYGEPPLPGDVPPYETERACAGAMLVPRSVLERVGLFDEALFAYWEDVDWSLRARAAGLRLLVVPASVVRHAVSASSGGEGSPATIYYSVRNGLRVAERRAPLGTLGTAVRRLELVAAHAAQVVLFSRRRRAGLGALARGYRDFRRGRLGPMR